MTVNDEKRMFTNDDEADFAVCLIQSLFKQYPELGQGDHIAVISLYKAQVRNTRKRLEEKVGARAKMVDVNTIDGFQGREKDICIFSVVRAPHRRHGGLGFVADERRVNVGLTRARASLFVIGAADSIKGHENWGGLVDSAYRRKCALRVEKPFGAFLAKHTKVYDDGNLSGDEGDGAFEVGERPSLVAGDDDMVVCEAPKKPMHVHNPNWTGAAEFVRAISSSFAKDGYSKDGFRDELITEAPTTLSAAAVVGGDEDVLGGVEDGNDEARDAFT